MSARLIRADARHLPLAAGSVDLFVTSPPYFAQRSYEDGGAHYAEQIGAEESPTEYVDSLLEATVEMVRVLKPTGSIWVNLADKFCSPGGHTDNTATSRLQGRRNIRKQGRPDRSTSGHGVPLKSLHGLPWRYALRCVDELGLTLRRDQIWSKPNPVPESCTDRTRTDHEYWFHFTVRPRYYANLTDLRDAGSTYARRAPTRITPPGQRTKMFGDTVNAQGRLPGSVWSVPSQPLRIPLPIQHAQCCAGEPRPGCEDGTDHFAAFPMEWPRRIISGWCPPGGVVADPFGGTGTTALVADVLGRNGLSFDRSAAYCRIAEWRVHDPAERAAAMRVERPPRTPAGIGSLLDLLDGDQGRP